MLGAPLVAAVTVFRAPDFYRLVELSVIFYILNFTPLKSSLPRANVSAYSLDIHVHILEYFAGVSVRVSTWCSMKRVAS